MAFVEFYGVGKTYHLGEVDIHALHDASFEVEKGELVVIVGPSGAGKTTLLNILGGMDTLSTGRVVLDGREISSLNRKQLTEYRRHDVGFVFQFYNLVGNLTALENVELANQICKDPLDAAEILREVGLGERMQNFPSQLSGGEQQRVAIARALAKNPKLLLCDEPTGALDTASGVQIMDIFRRLSQRGITIIMITHELGIAQCADKIYHILDGRLHTNGVPQYTPKEEAHEEA